MNDLQNNLSILGDRYTLLRFLGEGGMGSVWQALHKESGANVAIKVLQSKALTIPGLYERFEQEAYLSSYLHHPGIVSVLENGTLKLPTGSIYPFSIMEYVEGESWRDHLESMAPVPLDYLLALFERLLDVLGYMHARQIIHRDIKPENILIVREDNGGVYPRLLDFGIAAMGSTPHTREPNLAHPLTQDGAHIGTPGYMSPEQFDGYSASVGPRSDLYSVGVMLYEALTNQLPLAPGWPGIFAGPRPLQLAPHIGATSIPPSLRRLIYNLLQWSYDARPPSAAEVREALASIRRGLARKTNTKTIIFPTWQRSKPESIMLKAGNLSSAIVRSLSFRETPLIGRESLLTKIEPLLENPLRTSRPHCILFWGPKGVGKQYIARTLFLKLCEEGWTQPLQITLMKGERWWSALSRGLDQLLRRPVRERKILDERLTTQLGGISSDARNALFQLLMYNGDLATLPQATRAQVQEHLPKALLGLANIPRLRPLLLLIETTDWTEDLVTQIEILLSTARQSRTPLLILSCVNSDSQGQSPVTQLQDQQDVAIISVDPLSEKALGLIARQWLPNLSSKAEQKLVTFSDSSPTRLREVLQQWLTEKLFYLDRDGELELIQDFGDLQTVAYTGFNQRLECCLAQAADRTVALRALCTLALLGEYFSWRQAQEALQNSGLTADSLRDEGFLAGHTYGRDMLWKIEAKENTEKLIQEVIRTGEESALRVRAIELRLHGAMDAMGMCDWIAARHHLKVVQDNWKGGHLEGQKRLISAAWDLSAQLAMIRRDVEDLEYLIQNVLAVGNVSQSGHIAMHLWRGQIAWLNSSLEDSQEIFQTALQLAKENQDHMRTSLLLFEIGRIFHSKGEHERAKKMLDESLLCNWIPPEKGTIEHRLMQSFMTDIIYLQADIAIQRHQFDAAQSLLQTAREQHEATRNFRGEAVVYLALARLFLRRARGEEPTEAKKSIGKARRNLSDARERFEEIDDPRNRALLESEFAVYLNMQGLHEDASDHFVLAARRFELAVDQRSAMACLNNAGEASRHGGNLEHARELYRQVIERASSMKDARTLGVSWTNLGWLSLTQDDSKTAEQCFTQAQLHLSSLSGGPWQDLLAAQLGLLESHVQSQSISDPSVIKQWESIQSTLKHLPPLADPDVKDSLRRLHTRFGSSILP